jgi:hypothetical protein
MHAALAKSSALWSAPLSQEQKARLVATLVSPLLEYGLVSYPVCRASVRAVHCALSAALRTAFQVRVRWDDADEHVHTEALYRYTPFALVTWTAATLSAFGHWVRAGRRGEVDHPVFLTVAGATAYESERSVRAALTQLAAPATWEDVVAGAVRGGTEFRALIRRAERARFRDVIRDVLEHRLGDDHVPADVWRALWKGWHTRGRQ